MYKVQLVAACLVAATQAIDLQHPAAKRPQMFASQIATKQEEAASCCCNASPCIPTCSDMCDENNDHADAEELIDTTTALVEEMADEAEDTIDQLMHDATE